MQTCFEILGIPSSSTQKELKRAYFSMVRLHPPEKDPEIFKQIRAAYEEATLSLEMDVPVFADSDNPKELEIEQSLKLLSEKSDIDSRLRLCKTGIQKFPKNQFFLYTQIGLLRIRGQGTNAIKSAEKLLKLDPDNRFYEMELALCYINQGWTKRALPICEKVMAKGTRNVDFILGYVKLLNQYASHDKIYSILYPLITGNECQNAQYLSNLAEACIELIATSAFLDDAAKKSDAANAFADFIKKNQNLLGKDPVTRYCKELRSRMQDSSQNQKSVYRNAINALQQVASGSGEARKVAEVVGSLELDKIMNDSRLPNCAHILYRAYIMTPDLHPNAVKMDARLCGIMEREELLACKDILKQDYPDFYTKILTFLRAISTEEKAEKLKEELLEKYEEYDFDYFPDRKRYYYELYPEEMPEWMDDDYYDDDDEDDYYRYFFDDEEDDFDDDDDPFYAFLKELARRHGNRFPF
ncbi:MAG: hypothetical protein IJ242_17080 [Clostridia bacterium]|nr:hypothetical protein [Clostridia bacterium]